MHSGVYAPVKRCTAAVLLPALQSMRIAAGSADRHTYLRSPHST